MTSSNYFYTSPNAAWLYKSSLPKICRFSLNGKEHALCFTINILEDAKKRTMFGTRAGLIRTLPWFIQSLANTMDWNKLDI
jgi:hypothetical protein